MATLTGATIASTYPLLLKVDSNGLDTTLRAIEDGNGDDSALYLATNKVGINGTAKLYFNDTGGEHISSDGTDLTIEAGNDLNLTAVTDINIPANVGLTFGHASNQKIEGDGTDLAITATGNVNVTSTVDEAGSVKIEENGGTSGTVRIYANQGTGADSINIESDGGGITLDAGNTTHGVKVGTVDSAPVTIGHTTSETTVADNLTVTGNATVSGNLTASANLTATTVNGQTFTNTLGATGGVVRIFNPVSYQSGVGDGYVGSGSGITTTVTGRIHTSGAGNGSVNGPTTQITTPADGMDVYLLTVVATRKDGDGSLGTAYSHYSGAYIVTITSETNNRMTITALAEDDTESKLSVSSGNNGYVEIILATSSTFQGRMRFNLLQLIRGDKD